MKTIPLCISILAVASIASVGFSASSLEKLKTNFVIESKSNSGIEKGAPCYLAFQSESVKHGMAESGALDRISAALLKKGYLLVQDPSAAVVFVKVDYLQGEPYESDVEISQRPHLDYSNSIATANLAARASGRFEELDNTSRYPNEYSGETILGPDGKPIHTGKQRDTGAEVVDGEKNQTKMIVYPLMLQIGAWKMETRDGATKAINQWNVTTKYANIRAEELNPQLDDMAKSTVKYLGKALKEPKTVPRR